MAWVFRCASAISGLWLAAVGDAEDRNVGAGYLFDFLADRAHRFGLAEDDVR